jgi:hypothetical protein
MMGGLRPADVTAPWLAAELLPQPLDIGEQLLIGDCRMGRGGLLQTRRLKSFGPTRKVTTNVPVTVPGMSAEPLECEVRLLEFFCDSSHFFDKLSPGHIARHCLWNTSLL